MPRFERETREEVIPSFPSPSISRLVQGKVFEVFGNANCFLKIYLQTRNVPLSISAAQSNNPAQSLGSQGWLEHRLTFENELRHIAFRSSLLVLRLQDYH